jgi:hypothetical protein
MSETNDTQAILDDTLRKQRRMDWKRRQAIQPSLGILLAPTLPERINRLNPQERHEVKQLIRNMKLRKIIRYTLAEAFHLGEVQKAQASMNSMNSMERLRRTVRAHESLQNYERVLTASDSATIFEPVITKSQQPILIEVPHATGQEF